MAQPIDPVIFKNFSRKTPSRERSTSKIAVCERYFGGGGGKIEGGGFCPSMTSSFLSAWRYTPHPRRLPSLVALSLYRHYQFRIQVSDKDVSDKDVSDKDVSDKENN